tara:strand:+ start:3888 stop:4553 length:666 start_codon:yes stop_codon:yes gene_type:complete
MNDQVSIAVCTLAISASVLIAGISTYTSDTSLMGSIVGHAEFNGLVNNQSLMNYQEDGLGVSINRSYFSWNPQGFDGSEMFYAGTGSLELVEISRSNGEDFIDLDMQISSGWSPTEIGHMYLWIQVYNDGQLTQEFDLDSVTGNYVGLVGGGFDRVLIGSYATAGIRDSHIYNERNAIAIDNLRAGTMIPAPNGIAIFSFAGMLTARRRRDNSPINSVYNQ